MKIPAIVLASFAAVAAMATDIAPLFVNGSGAPLANSALMRVAATQYDVGVPDKPTVQLMEGPATDEGSGIVGIPVQAYGVGYAAGDQVYIAGTVNYDGVHTLTQYADGGVQFAGTYVAETFPSTALMFFVQPQSAVDALTAAMASVSGNVGAAAVTVSAQDGMYDKGSGTLSVSGTSTNANGKLIFKSAGDYTMFPRVLVLSSGDAFSMTSVNFVDIAVKGVMFRTTAGNQAVYLSRVIGSALFTDSGVICPDNADGFRADDAGVRFSNTLYLQGCSRAIVGKRSNFWLECGMNTCAWDKPNYGIRLDASLAFASGTTTGIETDSGDIQRANGGRLFGGTTGN